MPIPQPNSSETESEFISRCISKITDEYDQTQAAAICYNTYRKKEEMSKKEDIFVLQPRKAENRGQYLSRCSNNTKMKKQYPVMKKRLGFCLNAFNEYYKYWSKLEFEKVPEDTALGLCIAEQKSKGFDYKEAYARCASKVVVPNAPIVMNENLLVEPVEFCGFCMFVETYSGEKVSIDYDDTLSTDKGFKTAEDLLEAGVELYIISARNDKEGMLKRAEELGIPSSRVYATGSNKSKIEKVKELGIVKHIDNNEEVIKELGEIGENFSVFGLEDACWEGYEPIGLKDRGDGRMVPNCVPIKE